MTRPAPAPAVARRTAWMLPGETMPVSHAAAPGLRLERLRRWLADLGYEPLVLGPPERPRRGPRLGAYREAGRMLAATPWLAVRARRERPGLVLAGSALHAPALRAIRAVLGRDVVLLADVIGIRSLETAQTTGSGVLRALHRRAWGVLERSLVRRADLVLTVNDRHAALLRRPNEQLRVATLRDAAERELVSHGRLDRSLLGIPARSVGVCFLGSLVCSRLEPIFAAWEELESGPPASPLCLVVIGDGPDLERYRRAAADRGWLGRSVLFVGALPRAEALAVARACDIAYSECWSEAGFPSKVFEYLALGLPIVIEGKPQMTEVLRDGHDAVFFRTPAELAAALRRLAGDTELRARLGAAGQATFLAGHTLERRREELAAALGALDRALARGTET